MKNVKFPFYKRETEAHWCSHLPRDQPAPGRETILLESLSSSSSTNLHRSQLPYSINSCTDVPQMACLIPLRDQWPSGNTIRQAKERQNVCNVPTGIFQTFWERGFINGKFSLVPFREQQLQRTLMYWKLCGRVTASTKCYWKNSFL